MICFTVWVSNSKSLPTSASDSLESCLDSDGSPDFIQLRQELSARVEKLEISQDLISFTLVYHIRWRERENFQLRAIFATRKIFVASLTWGLLKPLPPCPKEVERMEGYGYMDIGFGNRVKYQTFYWPEYFCHSSLNNCWVFIKNLCFQYPSTFEAEFFIFRIAGSFGLAKPWFYFFFSFSEKKKIGG